MSNTQSISRLFESYDVMIVVQNALGIFADRKHVLKKIQDRDVSMMGMFREQFQDGLSLPPLSIKSSMTNIRPLGNHLAKSLNSEIPS